jgi:hypothetical protein
MRYTPLWGEYMRIHIPHSQNKDFSGIEEYVYILGQFQNDLSILPEDHGREPVGECLK